MIRQQMSRGKTIHKYYWLKSGISIGFLKKIFTCQFLKMIPMLRSKLKSRNNAGKKPFAAMEVVQMNSPKWLKPALIGGGIGAVATVIVGFGWGGWVTGAKAEVLVRDESKVAVVAALAPICVEQSRQDPQAAATLAKLKDTSRYQQSDILMKAGWATMPGSESPMRAVASACMERLAAEF